MYVSPKELRPFHEGKYIVPREGALLLGELEPFPQGSCVFHEGTFFTSCKTCLELAFNFLLPGEIIFQK